MGMTVWLWAAAVATAGPLKWQPVGQATAPPVGDGRSVAWQASPQEIEIVQAGVMPRRLADPDGCANGLAAISRRALLFECGYLPNGTAQYAVVSRAAGTVARLAFGPQFLGAGGERVMFDAIGDSWIAGPYGGYHVNTDLYANWHDDRTLYADRDDRFGAHRSLDLDAKNLGRATCRGVVRHRAPTDFDTVPRYLRLMREGPWFLEGQSFPRLSGPLRLLRCRHTPRALGNGTQGQIGSGWVTWWPTRHGLSRNVRLLRLRDRHEFSGPLPHGPNPADRPLMHTASGIYVAIPSGIEGATAAPVTWTIKRARLP